MAQDAQTDFAAATAITITINSVLDGSAATATAVDLGNPAPFALQVHVTLDGNSASNVDYVEWYALWSDDNTLFTDANNAQYLHSTQMNGTTVVEDFFVFPVNAQYFKLYMINESGDSMLSSGNSAEYREMAVDLA